jgi:hypothetical protein
MDYILNYYKSEHICLHFRKDIVLMRNKGGPHGHHSFVGYDFYLNQKRMIQTSLTFIPLIALKWVMCRI